MLNMMPGQDITYEVMSPEKARPLAMPGLYDLI